MHRTTVHPKLDWQSWCIRKCLINFGLTWNKRTIWKHTTLRIREFWFGFVLTMNPYSFYMDLCRQLVQRVLFMADQFFAILSVCTNKTSSNCGHSTF